MNAVITSNSLPDIHPGASGNLRVSVQLRIVHVAANSVLVAIPDKPSKEVWLSRNRVVVGQSERLILCDPDKRTGKAWFDVCTVSMPVWLYRKSNINSNVYASPSCAGRKGACVKRRSAQRVHPIFKWLCTTATGTPRPVVGEINSKTGRVKWHRWAAAKSLRRSFKKNPNVR